VELYAAIYNTAVFYTVVPLNSSRCRCDGAWPRPTVGHPRPPGTPAGARVVDRRHPEPNFAGSGTTPTDQNCCCSILFEVDARSLLINCVPDTDRQTDRQMHSETNPADRPPAVSDSSCIFMNTVAGRLELLNVETWRRGNDFHPCSWKRLSASTEDEIFH